MNSLGVEETGESGSLNFESPGEENDIAAEYISYNDGTPDTTVTDEVSCEFPSNFVNTSGEDGKPTFHVFVYGVRVCSTCKVFLVLGCRAFLVNIFLVLLLYVCLKYHKHRNLWF